jgi:tRNA (guanine37-N1)-methyltransferase
MLKKAIDSQILEVELVDIRDFAEGKHKIVDDRPFGGGPGMLMKAEPIVRAVESVKTKDSYVIYLSPQGNKLSADSCERLAKNHKHLILISGHYEGIDQRAIDLVVDEEISIGDYVLTSGMIPALVLLDGTLRFVPGVLGNMDSAYRDSFHGGELKGPLYTRPAVFRDLEVPKVLQSGNHKEIASWREEVGNKKTLERENKKRKVASCTH